MSTHAFIGVVENTGTLKYVYRKFTEKLVNHIEHSITELERNGISRQMYEQLWATMPDFYSVKLRDGYLVESNPLESLLRVDNGGEFRAY